MPIVPNGHNGTLAGHKFDPENELSLPSELQDEYRVRRNLPRLSRQEKERRAAELTERYRIVGWCQRCSPKRPLVAGEPVPHYTNHAPPQLRAQLRAALRLSAEDRQALAELLTGAPEGDN